MAFSIGLAASLSAAASIEPGRLRRAHDNIRQLLFGKAVVAEASRHLGTPYAWGGKEGGDKGFDCSGFTRYVFKTFALEIPPDALGQYAKGLGIERPALQLGDLVFFASPSPDASIHVGIYAGEGSFIHAPGEGQRVKRSAMKGFERRYLGARRYLPDFQNKKETKP